MDLTTGSFQCFCGKFERDGIVCCHILRLFTQFDITHIPDKLIVKRWTISFREKELDKCKKEMVLLIGEDQSHNAVRYAIKLVKLAQTSAKILNLAKNFLMLLLKSIQSTCKERNSNRKCSRKIR